jgi:cytochrome c553
MAKTRFPAVTGLLLGLLALGLPFAAIAVEGDSAGTRPSASDPPGNATRGKALAEICLTCHAAGGAPAGDPPVPPPHLRHQRASSIFYALHDYKSGRRQSDIMGPLVEDLTDQQMRDLAAYLAGPPLDHPPTAKLADDPIHKETSRRCDLCHGETGMGEMQGIPLLTGQEQTYLERALAEYRDGRRTDPTMQAVARALPPERDADFAHYYAVQEALEPAQ